MNTWPCISHYELHIATVTRSSRALSDALSYTFANMQDGFKWNYFDPRTDQIEPFRVGRRRKQSKIKRSHTGFNLKSAQGRLSLTAPLISITYI